MLVDANATGADPAFAGLQCLRALWSDATAAGHGRLHASTGATRAALPREGLPVLVIHGADDGLVPADFSGGAYAKWARSAGRDVRYWRVANAQHFDAFLGLPVMGARYVPMLAYAYAGLDRVWAHLDAGAAMPGDAEIATRRRELSAQGLAPLAKDDLGLIP